MSRLRELPLSVEAGLDDALETTLLQAYFRRAASAAERGQVVLYKPMCNLLRTLWGLIQHAEGNPAKDFMAYATGRLDRCHALVATSGFDAHVVAVRAR